MGTSAGALAGSFMLRPIKVDRAEGKIAKVHAAFNSARYSRGLLKLSVDRQCKFELHTWKKITSEMC